MADASDFEESRQHNPIQRLRLLLHDHPTLGPATVLLVMGVFFALASPRFLSPLNLSLIVQQVMIVGTLGIGQTIIILTAGIDLSVGAIMVFSSIVMAKLQVEMGIPAPIAIPIGVLVGGASGALNGLLITRLRLPPFIVTLGTMSIFFALNIYVSRAATIRGVDMDPLLLLLGETVTFFGTKITYGTMAMLLMYALMAYVLSMTRWGRHVYAIGDDPEAARLSGVRVRRMLLSVYAVAGLIYGMAAWFFIGRIGAASPQAGQGANLDSITAVVIGGTSLFGGRGSIWGTLIGALIVGCARNGLTIIGHRRAVAGLHDRRAHHLRGRARPVGQEGRGMSEVPADGRASSGVPTSQAAERRPVLEARGARPHLRQGRGARPLRLRADARRGDGRHRRQRRRQVHAHQVPRRERRSRPAARSSWRASRSTSRARWMPAPPASRRSTRTWRCAPPWTSRPTCSWAVSAGSRASWGRSSACWTTAPCAARPSACSPTWACSPSRTSARPWRRSPAVSGRAWRSHGPPPSAAASSSWTSRPRRSGSGRADGSSSSSATCATGACRSSSSATTSRTSSRSPTGCTSSGSGRRIAVVSPRTHTMAEAVSIMTGAVRPEDLGATGRSAPLALETAAAGSRPA